MYIDNIINTLQEIEYNLTLKKDYTDEIEKINNLKDAIETLSAHQWNTPYHKIKRANEKANEIIKWMTAEMESK
jgi:hypothetical protein